MIDLSSFPQNFNAAIIGSSGGIGAALVSELKNCAHIGHIYSLSRSEPNDITIDICDESSISQAVQQIDKPLHLLIVATGLLHQDDLSPEKSLRNLDAEKMREVYDVNTIGPALIIKHFTPLFAREGKTIIAALSARVGSISDNQLGGWHSYRASKAALNMIIKNSAIEISRKYKEMAVIGLHPGTVDTKLSKPFQGQVKKDSLFTPDKSAHYLLNVLANVNANDSGKIFAWDGKEITP